MAVMLIIATAAQLVVLAVFVLIQIKAAWYWRLISIAVVILLLAGFAISLARRMKRLFWERIFGAAKHLLW